MATRLYLPSSGAPVVTPSSWMFGSQIASPVTYQASTQLNATALTTISGATGTTSPTTRGMGRWIIGPLEGQSISGTVKGNIRCSESNAGANANPALGIKLIQPGGSDRSTLLAIVASDSTSTPPEMLVSTTPNTGAANRRFLNASETTPHTLTTQTATAGDFLVIEIGFRSATTVTRNIYARIGTAAGSDNPENDTDTNDYNPWVEFSANLVWLPFFGAGELRIANLGERNLKNILQARL